MRHSELGFSLVSIPASDAGGLRTVARFQCVECGATCDHKVRSGTPLNAEAYAKDVVRRGWLAKPFRKAGTYCPRCAGPQPKSNDPNSELKRIVLMTSVTPIKPAVAVMEPSSDQRMRIRNLLDKHFDDGAGMYLDQMSDLKIAEQCGVPRIVVERMREAAYGPIRVDPVLAGLRADMADVKRGMEALAKRVSEISSQIEKYTAGRAA